MDEELSEHLDAARAAIDAVNQALARTETRAAKIRAEVGYTVRAACAWEADQLRRERDEARAEVVQLRARETLLRVEVAVAERAACVDLAERTWIEHPLTVDRYHEPGCICDAIGRGACPDCDRGEAVIAAIRARGKGGAT